MKRRFSPIIIVIVLAGIASTIDEILGAIISNHVPWPIYQYASYLLISTIIVGIALAIWGYRLQAHSELPSLRQSNMIRRSLMAKVHDIWITGVLEESLHGVPPTTLKLLEQPDAVDSTQEHLFPESDQPKLLPQSVQHSTSYDYIDGEVLTLIDQPSQPPLPTKSERHITQIYDRSDGALLILGEPCSGKTILLLELASDLLDRAAQNETHSIPVVFNLSSWTVSSLSFERWLEGELKKKYGVARRFCRLLIDDDQVIPLLDGLDDVPMARRGACVNAINKYRRRHGMLPIVLCSRSEDYLAQPARVRVQNVVVVEPLTSAQIDDYFSYTGREFALTHLALDRDPRLKELITTPFMLNMLILAGRGMTIKNLLLTIHSPALLRQLVFEKYIQHILQKTSPKTRYTLQEVKSWLAWLAHQLVYHNQTEFFVEQLQPDWLPQGQSRIAYQAAVRLFSGSVVGLISGIAFGLVGGIVVGMIFGLAAGLVVTLVGDQIWPGIQPIESVGWSWMNLRRGIFKLLTVGLLTGLIVGLIVGPIGGLASGFVTLLGLGLLNGLSGTIPNKRDRVRPNQGIWHSARNSMLIGGVSGLISGVGSGLVGGLISGLAYGLFGGLVGGLGFWLYSGGMACIKHIILRMILWRARYIPRDYISFLDYAAECNLLCKMGGGYIFVHSLLFEYFAGPDTLLRSNALTARAQEQDESLDRYHTSRMRSSFSTEQVQDVVSEQANISRNAWVSQVKLLFFILGSLLGSYALWIRGLITLSSTESLLWGILILGLFLILLTPLFSWFSRNSSQWIFSYADERRRDISEDMQIPLLAIAHTTLDEGDRAFIGGSYSVYAGISRDKPDAFIGEPFDLLIQNLNESISFDVSLLTSDNIECTTPWHQHLLYYPHNHDPLLADFRFQIKQQGKSYLVIDFYHERHWLKTIRFDFKATEQKEWSTVLSEV